MRDPDVRDSSESYIYKQVPAQFGDDGQPNHVHMGQSIDIWLSAQKKNIADTTTRQQP
jgi:hypothetical protein